MKRQWVGMAAACVVGMLTLIGRSELRDPGVELSVDSGRPGGPQNQDIGLPLVNPFNGHTYVLLQPDTWENCEAKAVKMGGHLVTINSAAEQAWLVQTFGPRKDNDERGYWIGLHEDQKTGEYVWSSGEKLNYTNWGPGEPNSKGTPDGKYVHEGRYGSGQWNDTNIGNDAYGPDAAQFGPRPRGLVEIEPKHVDPKDPAEIARLIAALSDEAFATREDASTKLAGMGQKAYVAVHSALVKTADAEAKARLEKLAELLVWTTFLKDGESLEDYAKRLELADVRHNVVRGQGDNLLAMPFALIPAGVFLMGSPTTEYGRNPNEAQHGVEISHPFFMGTTPVTQGQWKTVMGTEPSGFKGANDLPVEMVSWKDAVAYCAAMTKEAGGKKIYRLPTEAEWEYACRAGTADPFNIGRPIGPTDANFNGNQAYPGGVSGEFRVHTTAVETFAPNAWGLHDMHGNVWQWCADGFEENPPREAAGVVVDPIAKNDALKVVRGGSWCDLVWFCRSASREPSEVDRQTVHTGFRVVEEVTP